jgi:hypothetical protein
MAEIKYKYNINHFINDLPKSKSTDWVIAELEKEGIKSRTFFRDKAIEVGDDQDIPSERLLIYAKFFGVTLDELFNYTMKVKPAIERKPSTTMAKVIQRTGLKK